VNGVLWTLVNAGGATVTGDGVNGVILTPLPQGMRTDGLKPANSLTQATALAAFRVDYSYGSTGEVMGFKLLRAQHQLQVGSIHVGISEHGPQSMFVRQVSKSSRHAGLARSTFTAQNYKLLHVLAAFFVPDQSDSTDPEKKLNYTLPSIWVSN
jgi:hypothetical protein